MMTCKVHTPPSFAGSVPIWVNKEEGKVGNVAENLAVFQVRDSPSSKLTPAAGGRRAHSSPATLRANAISCAVCGTDRTGLTTEKQRHAWRTEE